MSGHFPWTDTNKLIETFRSGFSVGDIVRFKIPHRCEMFGLKTTKHGIPYRDTRFFNPGDCGLVFEMDIVATNHKGEILTTKQVGLQSHFGASVSLRFLFEGEEFLFSSTNPLSFTFRNQMKVLEKQLCQPK